MVNRGEIWWANLPEPTGSSPGYRRPVLIVQSNDFNHSKINTTVVLILSTNNKLAESIGNVLLKTRQSGLSKDSVVNVSQLYTIDESFLTEYVETLSEQKMEQIDKGLRLVLSI
jgi:mRNA interferase MazF